jgi:hypothetical protein
MIQLAVLYYKLFIIQLNIPQKKQIESQITNKINLGYLQQSRLLIIHLLVFLLNLLPKPVH